MTSPEPAPPADPTSYRRRGFGVGFWVMMGLCLLCILGGVFIAQFVPKLFPVDEKSVISFPAIPFVTPPAETEPQPVETAAAPAPEAR